MANRYIARLDSQDLPVQFSYQPYVPRKRTSVTATAKGIVTQAGTPLIVHGDGTIAWECLSCYPTEYQSFYDWYDETGLTLMTFEGYWGETLKVYFNVLDQPKVRGRLFDLSGQFQVIEVTVPQNATCQI